MEYDVEKISHKIKNKKITKRILKCIIYVLLIFLFVINAILLYQNIFQKDGKNKILNIYLFNIISRSMEPTLQVDDVVIVKATRPQELKVGDIITFLEEERTISHRIIEIFKEGGQLKFQTKGDNNEVPDNFRVDGSQVYGKVLFKIKGIGGIVGYIQNINGFINGCVLVLIVFALIGLRDKQKNTRKIKRKKYEIKKLRDSYNI